MIHIVCGMIGAGKSTYCKDKSVVSDFYGEVTRKSVQIANTLRLANEYPEVWHITTYPCGEEEEAFKNCEKEYIWINTSVMQCKRNILRRNRERDVKDLKDTLAKNREIVKKYEHSSKRFIVVDVFNVEERW